MSGSPDERAPLTACAGCAPEPEASVIGNRPGLPALQYRIGTWSSFVARMLAALPRQTVAVDGTGQQVTPLAALNTRAADDPSIALIDAFATTADVLTFYQERIANEGFLRTATERQSVLQLARAIGYQLGPGVAASTYLAFTLDTSAGAPTTASIPVGSQVQSVPGPGQTAQTFETARAITARVDWNALRPRLTQPQTFQIAGGALALGDLSGTAPVTVPNRLYLSGTATGLNPGDLLLAVAGAGGGANVALPVLTIATDDTAKQTIVGIAPGATAALPALPPPVYPAPATTGSIDTAPLALEPTVVAQRIVAETWDEASLSAFCAVQGWDPAALTALVAQVVAAQASQSQLFVFRQKLACFGHNAPRYAQVHQQPVPDPDLVVGVLDRFHPRNALEYREARAPIADDVVDQLTLQPSQDPDDWDLNPRSIWQDAEGNLWRQADRPFDVFLERTVGKIVPGGWVLFQQAGQTVARTIAAIGEQSLTEFALGGRATGLALSGADQITEDQGFLVRRTTAFVQSEALPLAPLPAGDIVQASAGGAVALELDHMIMGLSIGQILILTGTPLGDDDTPSAPSFSEAVELGAIIHRAGTTTLYFARALTQRYARASVTLTANVAAATHGQTIAREILGGGNASAALQAFTLQKAPLTWVSAPTATGRASAITVRVDDDAWTEVPSLYGQAPDARVYALQTADDGSTTVQFGDGVSGSRLPTGSFNVAATYRSGLGLAGQVPAGSLTTLLSRPLGVRKVTNPLAADGAADPQGGDDARANAPVATLTLGRIVSIRDYQGFVRAFAGVGKAQAVAMWDGRSELVQITVAAADGTPLDPSSTLFASLTGAIAASSDDLERVVLSGFSPRYFRVQARLVVDPAADADAVTAAVAAAVQATFSFAARGFGQSVSSAEVIAVMQATPGVVAVEMQTLVSVTDAGTDAGSGVAALLPAATARWQSGAVALAELLTLHPLGVTLTTGTTP